MKNKYESLPAGKWKPSIVSDVIIGIEIMLSDAPSFMPGSPEFKGKMSRVLLNTILPETDAEYEMEEKEITAIVNAAIDAVNGTIVKGINPKGVADLIGADKAMQVLASRKDEPSDVEFMNVDAAIKKALKDCEI